MSLQPKDAARLIQETHTDNAVLIGGQAVAYWIRHFGIKSKLSTFTDDIDYLGTRAEARRASARLKIPHKLKIATFEDNTPSSALLLVDLEGYPDPILIDFLASIIGVESKAIEKSAVVVEFEGAPLRVLHPLQLLQSKIWNLYQLEAKRTGEGIEQARLAIEIAAAYVDQMRSDQRTTLNAVAAIGKFAATTPARFAADMYGLDCLKAVPASMLREGALPENFLTKRWPQILANVGRR